MWAAGHELPTPDVREPIKIGILLREMNVFKYMCTYLRMCQLELLLNSMLVSMKTTMLLLLHLWYRVCLKECNSLFVRNFIFKMVETHAQCTLICSIHTSNFPNIPHQLLCS